MAESRAPGIYFEELPGRMQVTPADATLSAFIGATQRGRTDRPELVRGWADFVAKFGSFPTSGYNLSLALWEYFSQGGSRAMVQRIVGTGAVAARNTADLLNRSAGAAAFHAYAANEGTWGNSLAVGTLRQEVQAVGTISTNDGDGNHLPNAVDNVSSLNTGRLRFATLAGINIGDIYDAFNPLTGARVTSGPIMIVGMDASTNDAFIVPLDAASTFLADCPANVILRTASQHRAKTAITGQVLHGAAYMDVASAEGIQVGSLLTLHVFSHVPTLATRGQAVKTSVVVTRIANKRVYFSAVTVNTPAVALPVSKAAYLQWVFAGDDGVSFTANEAGTGGNLISVSIVSGLANSVTVVDGRHIQITFNVADPYTIAELIIAIAAHATASQLVTAALVGNDDTVVVTAQAQTMLAGGAYAIVESQEFNLKVYEDGAVAELYDFLSCVPTSPDYIRTRLGGTTDPVATDARNPSRRVFLTGDDATTDIPATELTEMPLAISSVALASGDDGSTLIDDDYVGTASPRTGVYKFNDYLAEIDRLNASGVTSGYAQRKLIEFAELYKTFDLILDAPQDATTLAALLAHRQQTIGRDSDYAQLFGAWGEVLDPRREVPRGTLLQVPPGPSVCAALAVAGRRGAHYSCGNMQLSSWFNLLYNPTPDEADEIAESGLSIIRAMRGQGIVIMGDRMLRSQRDIRRFGNVRRWIIYFKQSIVPALRHVLFEPTNANLLSDIERAVSEFLAAECEKGALFPRGQQSAAFSVKCDSETTTNADLSDGRGVAEVAVSPAPQLEQILFKLSVSAGGVQVDEQV